MLIIDQVMTQSYFGRTHSHWCQVWCLKLIEALDKVLRLLFYWEAQSLIGMSIQIDSWCFELFLACQFAWEMILRILKCSCSQSSLLFSLNWTYIENREIVLCSLTKNTYHCWNFLAKGIQFIPYLEGRVRIPWWG